MAVDKSVGTDSLAIAKKQEYLGKKFRIAFIGCGGIAGTHINALKTMPDVEIVAGVDIDPARLTNMEEKHGVTSLYKDWKTMLKEVRPDAVSVCTPNGVHMQPTIDALNAGCHVIVEKPMAMNPAECVKMIDAAKKNKKKLTIGFQYRYHPSSQFLKKAADAGEFGDIMFVKCQALRRRGIPNWGVFGQKKLQGGGPMIDIGVHVIEMAHYVMGSPRPVAATGNCWTYLGDKPNKKIVSTWPDWDYKTYTVEDLAIGSIRFDNGAILHIEAMFAGHIEKDVWNFNLMGTKGGANWDPPQVYSDRLGHMTNTSPGFLPGTDFGAMFKIKLRNFIDSATIGTPQEAPGEAGLAVQKILSGVYSSAAQGGKEFLIK